MVRKILVVNESAVMRKIVRTKIEANINDALVLEARDALEALAVVRDPGCHLVLYSCEVPGGELGSVFRGMREVPADRPLPILLMSSGDPEIAASKADSSGALCCLMIPCSSDDLVATIDHACSPVSMRRTKRYSISGATARLEQKGGVFSATVVNISEGGVLCQLDGADGYVWSAPVMMTLDFPFIDRRVKVPGMFSIPLHLNVLESHPDYTPKRIRIAFSFANLQPSSKETLQSVFVRTSEELSHGRFSS